MAKTDARFINGLEYAVAKLFAPVIAEGQSITCYVDEAMTPYPIHGNNIITHGSTGASYQEANTLSEQIATLSQRISIIEDILKQNGLFIEEQDTVLQMLNDIFSGDLVDDSDIPQDMDFFSMLDDVFSGDDINDPNNLTDDDVELFADFDQIFNT